MAVTLVVEDGTGLSTANSYCSLAEANTYFEKHLYSDVWDRADDEKREKALIMATRILDQEVRWLGERVEDAQALRWPRSGVTNKDQDDIVSTSTVPQWLKDATSELARALIEKPRIYEVENQRVVSQSGGRTSQQLGPRDNTHKSVVPSAVYSIIKPYIQGREFQVFRV